MRPLPAPRPQARLQALPRRVPAYPAARRGAGNHGTIAPLPIRLGDVNGKQDHRERDGKSGRRAAYLSGPAYPNVKGNRV